MAKKRGNSKAKGASGDKPGLKSILRSSKTGAGDAMERKGTARSSIKTTTTRKTKVELDSDDLYPSPSDKGFHNYLFRPDRVRKDGEVVWGCHRYVAKKGTEPSSWSSATATRVYCLACNLIYKKTPSTSGDVIKHCQEQSHVEAAKKVKIEQLVVDGAMKDVVRSTHDDDSSNTPVSTQNFNQKAAVASMKMWLYKSPGAFKSIGNGHDYFASFCKDLNSSFKVPSIDDIQKEIAKDATDEKRNLNLLLRQKNDPSICLTVEESGHFLIVRGSFLDDDFKMWKFTLSAVDQRDGKSIVDAIQTALVDFNIVESRITFITLSSLSTFARKKFEKDIPSWCEDKWMPCFIAGINSIFETGMKALIENHPFLLDIFKDRSSYSTVDRAKLVIESSTAVDDQPVTLALLDFLGDYASLLVRFKDFFNKTKDPFPTFGKYMAAVKKLEPKLNELKPPKDLESLDLDSLGNDEPVHRIRGGGGDDAEHQWSIADFYDEAVEGLKEIQNVENDSDRLQFNRLLEHCRRKEFMTSFSRNEFLRVIALAYTVTKGKPHMVASAETSEFQTILRPEWTKLTKLNKTTAIKSFNRKIVAHYEDFESKGNDEMQSMDDSDSVSSNNAKMATQPAIESKILSRLQKAKEEFIEESPITYECYDVEPVIGELEGVEMVACDYYERPLTVKQWLEVMIESREARSQTIQMLKATGFDAIYLESKSVSYDTMDKDEFVFVVIDNPELYKKSLDEGGDTEPFKEYLKTSDDEPSGVVSFMNKSGDALLVCPTLPSVLTEAQIDARSHLIPFLYYANENDVDKYFKGLCEKFLSHLEATKRQCYFSFHGLGVLYCHCRLDESPKYYMYEPYKNYEELVDDSSSANDESDDDEGDDSNDDDSNESMTGTEQSSIIDDRSKRMTVNIADGPPEKVAKLAGMSDKSSGAQALFSEEEKKKAVEAVSAIMKLSGRQDEADNLIKPSKEAASISPSSLGMAKNNELLPNQTSCSNNSKDPKTKTIPSSDQVIDKAAINLSKHELEQIVEATNLFHASLIDEFQKTFSAALKRPSPIAKFALTDSRFHSVPFASDTNDMKTIINEFKEEIKLVEKEARAEKSGSQDYDDIDLFEQDYLTEEPIIDQVEVYLTHCRSTATKKPINKNKDPLAWWREGDRSEVYPSICSLAKKWLSVAPIVDICDTEEECVTDQAAYIMAKGNAHLSSNRKNG